jgi:hypothetical protein
MERHRHHEIVRPLREIAQGLGEWAMNKIVPRETLDLYVTGATPTIEPRLPLQYDSEGNWHNPDGRYIGKPVPSVDGKDL